MNPAGVMGVAKALAARAVVRSATRRRDRLEARATQVVNHPVRHRSILLRVLVWSHVAVILVIALIGNLLAKADVPHVPFVSYQQQCGGGQYDVKAAAWMDGNITIQMASWPPKWSREPWKIPGWLWRQKDKKLGDYSPLPTTIAGAATLVFAVEKYVIKALMPKIPGGRPDGVTFDGIAAAAGLDCTCPAAPGSGAPLPPVVPVAYTPGSTTLAGVQVAQAAQAAGWPAEQLVTAVAVAKAESGWRPAVRNSVGASGLWQVLQSAHPQLFARYDWRNPTDNARMALDVYTRAGQSWSPWVAYTSGAYQRYLVEAQSAVTAAGVAPAAAPSSDCTTTPGQPIGDTTTCPPTGLPTESGLSPNALRVLRCVDKGFGRHTYHGVGSRPNASDHPSGHAVDVMLADYQSAAGRTHGDQVAAWLQANAGSLGITYMIWAKRIWHAGEPATEWETMSDRGSDTANHYDHVHVSVAG